MFEVAALRDKIREMEGTKVVPRLPVHPALSPLIGGGLVPGGVYSISRSLSLALGLAVESVRESGWCAAIGFPHLGIEAVRDSGIALERFVSIPNPKEHWATVVGAVCDGFSVVLARSPHGLSPTSAARVTALAHRTGAVLVVLGEWPGATARIEVTSVVNHGVGDGHGVLSSRDINLRASVRGVTKTGILPWPLDREADSVAPVRRLRVVS
jgi:hypothetical protein